MTAPTITCTPIPLVQGGRGTICYENGQLPVTLDCAWDPPGSGPATLECTTANGGCVSFDVGSNALQVTVTDPTEEAEYREIPVVPAT